MLSKLDGVWAPKPSAGPHAKRECLPLMLILRNRLKYALTGKECQQICMEKCVKIDGKVRTDKRYPAGFMDVITLEKTGDQLRLLYDTKGRFVLHKIKDEEKAYKLCRVRTVATTAKKIPYLVTHDGRTIRYPDPVIKKDDTVKLDLETGKIIDHLKFGAGGLCMITKGNNTGRIGELQHIEKHPGSFDICVLKDASGNVFSTRQQNVFIIGTAGKPWITLPKGKGIKMTILEQRSANKN
jgi:ribosomal protein S4E